MNQSGVTVGSAHVAGRIAGESVTEILGLRVPLPTLVLNTRKDGLYTMKGMREAERILAGVYAKAGAKDRFRCSFYPGGHKFDLPMQAEAFEWFDGWLKG